MHQVALAHDYLTQRRGAERVVLALSDIYPAAPIYTSLYAAESAFAGFSSRDVRPLPLDRIRWFRRHHRAAFPFLAPAFSALRIDAAVTIASTSGWAHGVRTTGAKLVYCHSPARWLYQRDRYVGSGPVGRAATAALGPLLKPWDRRAARSADRYLTNSTAKATEIAEHYGIEAEVVPAPLSLDVEGPQRVVDRLDAGFLLCVAPPLPYKNSAAVVAAMRQLPAHRLVLVGGVEAAIGADVPANVRVLAEVDDDELRWLYANCAALVSASYEDFGLTPIEAAAFGKPAAVLRFGGHLDTVIEGATGVLFDAPTSAGVAEAVRELVAERWDAARIRLHAQSFSVDRFSGTIRRIVGEMV